MIYVGVQRLPVGGARFPRTIANAVQAVVANDNMAPQGIGVVRSYAQRTGLRVEVGAGRGSRYPNDALEASAAGSAKAGCKSVPGRLSRMAATCTSTTSEPEAAVQAHAKFQKD